MKKRPEALLLFALLFAGWMAYLGSQVWKYRRPPVIVSRAQLLMAKYDVVAELAAAAGKPAFDATVNEVLYAEDDGAPKKESSIKVWNIADCVGYEGPRTYVLPLTVQAGEYRVAGLPFDPGRISDVKPRIYPATDEVKKQFHELRHEPGK